MSLSFQNTITLSVNKDSYITLSVNKDSYITLSVNKDSYITLSVNKDSYISTCKILFCGTGQGSHYFQIRGRSDFSFRELTGRSGETSGRS